MHIENKIIEDVLLYNVAIWNWSLISSQLKLDSSMTYSFLKKAKLKSNENIIDGRVRNWIEYYQGKKDLAVTSTKKLLEKCHGIEYLKRDLEFDNMIFERDI